MGQPYRGGSLPGWAELVHLAEEDRRFKVRRVEGITALNYAYVSDDPEQFRWPKCELRGLMVDEAAGTVLARPFQKFWGIQEKPAWGTDWTEEHVLLPKLDGSLVYPAGDRWVTRGGVTDTSGRAEKVAAGMGRHLEALLARVRTDPADGAPCTPCFEYTGPDNRIVLGYRVNALTLLTVRRIQDGRYWRSADVVRAWQAAREQSGGHDSLSVARPMTGRPADGRGGYAQRLAAAVGAWNGTEREGVVVAFEHSGHRVKIKSRQYVALHRPGTTTARRAGCCASGPTDTRRSSWSS